MTLCLPVTNMASHSGGFQPPCVDEEMASETENPKELSEFLKTALLPVCVCVIGGKHLTTSVQITKGDIIVLKSCEAKTVTLTHQDASNGSRKQVIVPFDFPYKFTVLPPKNVSERTASVFMYPSVADLVLDSPTYFEATTNYDDPYLPGFSILRGDRFKFRGLVTDPKDGRERLKVFDELDNVLLLSLDCHANFCPLEDEESYTLRQLIDFAPVPRRLRISKRHSTASSGDSGFKDCVSACEDKEDSSVVGSDDPDISQLINFHGVIHLLKPNLSVIASPLNDTETQWKIPLTADLYVRQHDLDDYEVPSVVKSQPIKVTSPSPPPTSQTPTFPAPPTPPLPQPLVPVDIFSFIEIYGCSVKAKIMDFSKCNVFIQNFLKDSEDLSIHRLQKTKRLYAEDLKSGKVYSFAEDVQISFIEYPEKFSVVSQLLKLPLGSEITVLEDIASDFPRPFVLQFGDLLRITSNTSSSIRPKNTSMECAVLKCERVNRDGGSNQKIKLPLDFEVKMVLSIDPNNRKVISSNDIITGIESIPNQEVATLIDVSEKTLQDIPVNLKLLKTLPDRVLVMCPFRGNKKSSTCQSDGKQHDWPSPTHHSAPNKNNRNIGISLTSGLVLAFRERLNVHEVDVSKAHAKALQVPFEIMTWSQYEEREALCKVWVEEEKTERQSVSSDERSSTIDSNSLGKGNSTKKQEKMPKKKKMDKIRRLSQVLNPKHWRPPKAPPEPLPHPEAMGLMALSMRPHSDQSNDYQIKGKDEDTSHSTHSSQSSEEEMNLYEDVEIRPLRTNTSTPPPAKTKAKGFTGPFHKSMPLKQIVSRTKAKYKANKKDKSLLSPSTSSPSHKSRSLLDKEQKLLSEVVEDPLYDTPEPTNQMERKEELHDMDKNGNQSCDIPRNNKQIPTKMATGQNATLPPLPPRRSVSSLEQENRIIVSKHQSLADQGISTSTPNLEKECLKPEISLREPPVPPRRKKLIKSLQCDANTENTNSVSNSSPKLDDKEFENLPVTNPVVSKPELTPNSETKKDELSPCIKDTSSDTLKTNNQKLPVPKPRGLKKNKPPELLLKTDCSSHCDNSNDVQDDSLVGKRESEDVQGVLNCKYSCDTHVTKETEETTLSCEASVTKKNSVKPKPPLKPKPRIG